MMYRQVTILKSNPSPGADYGEASELNLTLQGLQFSSSFLPETSAETSCFNTFSYRVLDAFIELFKLWSMILLCKSCIVLFFFWFILVYRFLGMVLTTLCSIRVRLCCASDCLKKIWFIFLSWYFFAWLTLSLSFCRINILEISTLWLNSVALVNSYC